MSHKLYTPWITFWCPRPSGLKPPWLEETRRQQWDVYRVDDDVVVSQTLRKFTSQNIHNVLWGLFLNDIFYTYGWTFYTELASNRNSDLFVYLSQYLTNITMAVCTNLLQWEVGVQTCKTCLTRPPTDIIVKLHVSTLVTSSHEQNNKLCHINPKTRRQCKMVV